MIRGGGARSRFVIKATLVPGGMPYVRHVMAGYVP